jgi:serine/threonine protein kinase
VTDATASALADALRDRYRLERELGQGGMATVYLAEDVRHRRQVAVKVLRPELAATLGSDRFFREIEVAARLQHPHILPLLDSGEAGGFYFYVMPYVAGESLRERLARVGELPVHDAVKILAEVVDALAAAHAMGVVHRDIKPDNVMLSGRHALVMDFGVAKAVSEATGRNLLTTAGVALGTPSYMAPEQAAADPHLDHRVDIYAVGVMGYELLTGRPPFSGGSSQEILAAHMTRPPEPVSSRRSTVPPILDAVIMKCLEKRPADRYQTAEELLAQLEPLATPSGGMTPTQTRPVTADRPKRVPGWVRAVGAILAGIAVLAVVLLPSTRPHQRIPVTLRNRVQLTSTGRVSKPGISPDGKQMAYVVTDCAERCTYGLEIMDVGGTATRRLVSGATSLFLPTWSPDRRSVLFTGTLNGRFASYLVSTVGGSPRLVSPDVFARFDASGDSVLSGQGIRRDGVCWVRVAGLDGVPRDSIRVPGSARWCGVVGAIPKSAWLVIAVSRTASIEFLAVDRNGHEGGHASLSLFSGAGFGWWRVAADALWIWWGGSMTGGDSHAPLIRVPFDPRGGRFAPQMDTVYTGPITAFDVTSDGGTVILDEGSAEFSAWAMELKDVFRGTFSDQHRRLRATTPIDAQLAPDGDALLIRRRGTGSRDELSLMPFVGGTETVLPLNGSLSDWRWGVNSSEVAVQERTSAGTVFTLIDPLTGERRSSLTVPDSGIGGWTPVAEEGWAWSPIGTKKLKVQRQGADAPRTFTVPDWYDWLHRLSAGSDGATLAVLGWGPAPNTDTLGVSMLSLQDGTFTPWASIVAEAGDGSILPDHSILVEVAETFETVTLYHVRGPGQVERLGTIPRPVQRLSVSNDLKRAAIVTRDYHGDAWMYRVVRP